MPGDVIEDLVLIPDEIVPPIDPDANEGRHRQPVEWWYFAGELCDEDGDCYGFEFTITSLWAFASIYQAYFSFIDPSLDNRYLGYVHDSIDAYSSNGVGFEFRFPAQPGDYESWICTSDVPGRYYIQAGFRPQDEPKVKRGINLELDGTSRAPLLHGDQGVVDIFGAKMGFYSRTRLKAKGGIRHGRDFKTVTGTVWLDHQWGEVRLANRHWKYLAAHLKNGHDFVYYEVYARPADPPLVASYTISDQGFTKANATSQDKKVWKRLPINNQFHLPGAGQTIVQKPVLEDQIRRPLNRRYPPELLFWEGYSRLENLQGHRIGSAFLELGGRWG